ncbi:MAG: hypothetical protein KAI66_01015 [Lentisphaeria bacterium]|nr:hypothetical protein [Lentisphaeria bacterium]
MFVKRSQHASFRILWAVFMALPCVCAFAQLGFLNASFEEDFENDEVPDHWEIPESTRVELVPDCTHGVKAAHFTDGYIVAAQNFEVKSLKGRKLIVSFDAKGAKGAQLGCQLGFFHTMKDGNRKFVYGRPMWNRVLGAAYEHITFRYVFPESALDGRVWVALYRSNRTGELWLDNASISDSKITPEQRKELVPLRREFGYLKARAEAAAARTSEAASAELVRCVADSANIVRRCDDDDASLLEGKPQLLARLSARQALVNGSLIGKVPFASFASRACERLTPDAVPPVKKAPPRTHVLLKGERVALGLTSFNCLDRPLELTVRVETGDGFQVEAVRQQVFHDTWYTKGKIRLADALPLLSEEEGRWLLPVKPGAAGTLFVLLRALPGTVGEGRAVVTLSGMSHTTRTEFPLRVLDASVPADVALEHMQFIYPEMPPAGAHPEETARDLAAHGVTGIEFPYIPKVTFRRDGSIATADFAGSVQAQWLEAYGKHIPHLMIFWEGRYKHFPVEGEEESYLPFISDDGTIAVEWKRAYAELLKGWLEFAQTRGFPTSQFVMLPDDEPSSKAEFATAPGAEVRRAVEIYKLTRKIAPELQQAVTLSDYAGPGDVRAVAPEMDIVMPLWPYREKLTRWAPKEYRPREEFSKTIYPILEAQRRARGMQIWSYRVDAGKTAGVLESGRAYPIAAVAAGFTGVATWAYNVSRGKTWDDTDKGLLDYSFIYDGTEDHPQNHADNPVGEMIVPSIRWEAMRLGMQDAAVLLRLKSLAEKDEALRKRCDAVMAPARRWADDPSTMTFQGVFKLARAARVLLAEQAAGE